MSLFRYRFVGQPDIVKLYAAQAIVAAAAADLGISEPSIQWLEECRDGPLTFDGIAVNGVTWPGGRIALRVDLELERLMRTALHEVRHVHELVKHPEDGTIFADMPAFLRDAIELFCTVYADEGMRKFDEIVSRFKSIRGG